MQSPIDMASYKLMHNANHKHALSFDYNKFYWRELGKFGSQSQDKTVRNCHRQMPFVYTLLSEPVINSRALL